MSTLQANNLTRQTGSGVPDLGGVAANRLLPSAWANFNGTGVVAIRDAHNVASITDGGVGVYTINFTVLMDNINFAAVYECGFASTGMTNDQTTFENSAARTTASTTVYCSFAGVANDPPIVQSLFFGGRA